MLRVAGPVILAELGWMSMGVVDTIMVGPLGPAAIGAVGVGNAIHFAYTVFGMGLLLGLDTLVSQAYGAGRLDECRAWLRHGVALALLLTPPFLLIGFLLLRAVPAMGFHEDVRTLMQPYFAVTIWSTPFLIFFATFRRYLQGMHWVTPVMFALVSANVVNAFANWVLIFGHGGFPALGVTGSAWATLLARIYMAGVLWIAVRRLRIRDAESIIPFNIDYLKRLIRLGFPAASQIALEVGVFAASSALAGRLSPVAAASHQVAINFAAVSFMIPLGLSSAAAVRVGHAVGAHDRPRASAAGWTAILLAIAFTAVAALVFLSFPRALIGLFTTEPNVLALGSTLLLVAAAFQLFDGFQGVITGVLRGLGDTRTPMIWNLIGHWFFGLPVGYTLCFRLGYGVVGLWIGLSIGLILVAIVLMIAWIKEVKHIR